MTRILQIGLGGFGRMHVQAWTELGLRDHLWIAELSPERQAWAVARGVPRAQVIGDFRQALQGADIVDIVTATDTHGPLCREALAAGKDVFIEKPFTLTANEARELAAAVEQAGRIVQIGFYYRVHPIAQWMKEQIASGALGELRYINAKFLGFKRCRTDVGVTHTDAIHFIDLVNWLIGSEPQDAFAVTRDHFKRGLEDLSVVLLTYPSGLVANVESGYIQPGQWNDRVVPHAKTTKTMTICGSRGTIEADFETGAVELFRVRHEQRDGIWQLVSEGSTRPALPSVGPVDQVRLELEAFLRCVASRATPEANADDSGVKLAELMETIYQSAAERRVVSCKSDVAPVVAGRAR